MIKEVKKEIFLFFIWNHVSIRYPSFPFYAIIGFKIERDRVFLALFDDNVISD